MLFLLVPRAPTVLARDRAVHNMLRLGLFFQIQDFEPGTLYHVNVLARTLQNLRSLVSHPLLQLTVRREESRHWAPLCLPVLTLDGKACIFLPNSRDLHFFCKPFGISLVFWLCRLENEPVFDKGNYRPCYSVDAQPYLLYLFGKDGGTKVIYFGTCADFGHGLLRKGPRGGSAFDIFWNHLGGRPRLKCSRPGATGIVQAWLSKISSHRNANTVRVIFVPHRRGQVNVNAMMRRIELPSWGRRPARFNTAKQSACRW